MSVICPNCGRENPDIRLFCASCGEVLPDPEEKEERPKSDAAFAKIETPPEKKDAEPEIKDIPDDTEFYRRRQRIRNRTEKLWLENETPPVPKSSLFDVPEEEPEPDARVGEPELPVRRPGGRANTFIPKRSDTMNPDDFFAVKGQVLPEYPEEPAPRRQERNSRDEFEDEYTGGFIMRHLRGFVAGLLLLLTAGILLIWANTAGAQRLLAQIDLAWRADAYEQLGMEAYDAKDYDAAGHYFTQALNRDEDNYQYALYAANSYINGDYVPKAVAALRRCIEIEPAKADLYLKLTELQGGYDNLPESDRELVKKGYERTGDERLKYE